jgi:sulfite exporter TauE/SafE
MNPAELATPLGAFLFGVLGSAHCVAMCGGIAAALALRAPDPRHAFLHSLGRVLGYALAGALVGGLVALGAHGAEQVLDPRPVGLALRLFTALLFVAVGLRLLLARPPWRALERLGAAVWQGALAPLAQRVGRAEGPGAALALGVLWGWLPCGMSWTALLAAGGALTMLAFGLGTLPAVGLGGWLFGRSTALAAPGWRRLAGALLVGVGLWAGWGTLAAPHAHPDAPAQAEDPHAGHRGG